MGMTRRQRRAQWLAEHRDRHSVDRRGGGSPQIDPPASVHLEIDELVLHGIEPRHRYAIADAAGAQLADRFGDQPPAFERSSIVDELHAPAFPTALSSAHSIGVLIGESVYSAASGVGKS
jgi:hypothetical protein